MLRKLGLVGLTLAMFSIAGGHWAMLQSVAWVQMLAEYSQQSGNWVTGVEQTFDGQHPCALCQKIQAAKSQEQTRSPAAFGTKDDAPVKALLAAAAAAAEERRAVEIIYFSAGWNFVPIAPQPR